MVEPASHHALRRVRPAIRAFGAPFPFKGADAGQACPHNVPIPEPDLHPRMFSPLDGIVEDRATGSATLAAAPLLSDLSGAEALALTPAQGFDAGRPSRLLAQARRPGPALAAFVAGRCVAMLEGSGLRRRAASRSF